MTSFPFRTLLLLLTAGSLCLGGCGDEAAPRPEIEVPLPAVAPVPMAGRVAYALERLERGPRPVGALPIPDIHRRSLAMAEQDLLGLEAETQRLLADPERIARVTALARSNADPWHNVLRVLQGMEDRPVELSLAWTRPLVELPLPIPGLRLEAARVLSLVRDERAAELLLRLFEQDPAERDLANVCFPALVAAGGGIRARALEVALERGAPRLWSDAWRRMAAQVPAAERDARIADALAWWCALTAGGGPRLPTGLPHLKSHPWAQARLATDPAVPGEGRLGGVYGPLPAVVAHDSGVTSTELSRSAVLPSLALVYTGKLPAAEGRCQLAVWGHEPYRHAVRADLRLEAIDLGLYYAAHHCMLDGAAREPSELLEALRLELDSAEPWTAERVRSLQQVLSGFASCDVPGLWALLARVLFEVQPLDVGRPAVEQAYALMESRTQEVAAIVVEAFEGSGTQRRATALHLMRSSRDPIYLDALARRLDTGAAGSEAGAVRRTMAFIHTRGYGVEPERQRQFVERYRGWLAEADERTFSALATGLLDLGEPGEQAFLAGLRGPRRARYLAAWPRDGRLVSNTLAVAALEPLGAETPPAELAGVLALAWYSFPAESAPHLVALKRRLPATGHALVEAALDRVQHRAPFQRRVRGG